MKSMKAKALLTSLAVVLILFTALLPGCDYLNLLTTTAYTESPPTSTTTAPINPAWTPPVSANQSPLALPDISSVVARVKPSVVAITTEVVALDFFNRQFTEEGAGSGWIVDSSGIIVTNNHVVDGAKTITVTLDNGESYQADVKSVATATLNDLAIVKINATGLPALPIGNSTRLRVGDWVIAIG